MYELFSVPRINALGLKGPEKSSEKILEGKHFKKIETNNENISKDEEKIYEIAKEHLNQQCFFVGGDHSITYPIGKAFLEKHGRENSILIVFDAHPDCMPSMNEPTHEEVIYALVKRGWDSKNIILIGIRKFEPEEEKYLKEKEIKYFTGKEENLIKRILEFAHKKKVYVSIDIDAIDPVEAPGVNYPEKKGLTKQEFLLLINQLKKLDIKAIDLVEIVLEKDVESKTLNLSKEIIKQIID